ncbi:MULTISPECIES: CaiB/BaiF CoA-transferase family protein [unclassified Streptomyces]|uniref:CaiB/BaiF CoA transferase family protein n=1 Tax=unclassified Streptomyces TaxID=2593676 RepID=UPI000367D518|nr:MULTISPECIES: CaiB/BaiF CoA-transferase family protein [unclassified Streptomyces]MYX37446.1 CoA transferase [Streptomyces sp. SID8377]
MVLPLHGLRVVDFTRVLAGPHAGKHLLDLGAEVIKIEPPTGDVSRLSYPTQGAISGYYAQQNAGKRNISIDLNVPEARKIVLELCDSADVIIENFRPGALAFFGLDYESVSRRNPRVIYVSMSGYGQHGPWRSRMAYAPAVQAETGFTSNTLRHFGLVDSNKYQTDPLSHADVYTGLHGLIAVLAALNHRHTTGEGQYVDVAMAAVMTSISERTHYDLSGIDLGDEPPILGAADANFFISPEGHEFVISASLVSSLTFSFYLNAMRRPDLADDPRFRTPQLRARHIHDLRAIVQTWIYTFDDVASLDTQLDEAKLASGIVRTPQEFVAGEWAQTWPAVQEVPDRAGGQITIPGSPWHFGSNNGQPAMSEQIPAFQGEHNRVVLTELGYDEDTIEALFAKGALVEPARETVKPS